MTWPASAHRSSQTGGGQHARQIVFLGDGAEWIWGIAKDCFPGAIEIVAFYHACEHLHPLCLTLEPDASRAQTLFAKWRKILKKKGLARLLHPVEKRLASAPKTLYQTLDDPLDYFRKTRTAW